MSLSLQDRIRKRREEDDNDIMMFLSPVLYLMDSSSGVEKKKHHTSEETREVKVRRLREGHVNCQVEFRMEPYVFKRVASYFRRTRLLVDTRIKVEEKLAVFLYMLSHNASNEKLQVQFGHNNDTFHHHMKHYFKVVIHKVCHCSGCHGSQEARKGKSLLCVHQEQGEQGGFLLCM
ncbi:hypothetical protein QOZ80_8AG0622220 [Eleusine coracana subsp. coracana]|nr:hypothetical protein QOZ80_8AG0622220 [Eleusine coracana subsp. coracana]